MRYLLVCYALLLLGCSREYWRVPMAAAADSTPALTLPSGGKWKFNGPVTVQLGTGNTSSAVDNTKAGSRGGSAATAPKASAAASTEQGAPPWWLYLLVAAAGAVGWEYFSPKLPLAWLPWRKAVV